MVDILLPLYSTVPMVLAVEGTKVDSAMGAERNGTEMFGQLQGTRQHTLNWSKGKDGHLLSGPRREPVWSRTSKIGQLKQEWKHGNLLGNLLKGFRGSAGTMEGLDQIKDPTQEVVVPTFRTPPRLVFGLHDGAEHSVGLQPQPLQNDKSGAVKEPTLEAVVPTF